MHTFILLVETAPRSKKQRFIIGKLDADLNRESDNQAPLYHEFGVGRYFEETLERVAALNRADNLAANSRLDKGGS